MEKVIDLFNSQTIIVKIIVILTIIFIYTMFSVLLNKLNNAKYGKNSIIAWIPGLNVFLLGKLVIHWIIGILLFLGLIFGILITFKITCLEMIYNLLIPSYVNIYQIVYLFLIIILFILGKLKLNKIIRDGSGKDDSSQYITKDYSEEEKKPEIVTPKEEVVEQIQDNYQYTNNTNNTNHTSLSDLNNNSKENPK